MPLANTIALTTLDLVKAELGIALATTTYDTVIERQILAASQAIENYCGRKFRKETLTEKYAGTGTQRLLLERTPVVSITSIEDDGSEIDADTYEIEDADAGIVWGESSWTRRGRTIGIAADFVPGTGQKLIEVAYSGGYVLPGDSVGTRNLPYDIEEAAIITAVSLYRARGADRRVAAESVGDGSATYRLSGGDGIIPQEAVELLAKYRRIF